MSEHVYLPPGELKAMRELAKETGVLVAKFAYQLLDDIEAMRQDRDAAQDKYHKAIQTALAENALLRSQVEETSVAVGKERTDNERLRKALERAYPFVAYRGARHVSDECGNEDSRIAVRDELRTILESRALNPQPTEQEPAD